MDATNLESAVLFVKTNRTKPKQISVDIKGWVRIKRDLSKLFFILPTPYSQVPSDEKWLWHEHKALMKRAPIQILGVPVVMVR